VNARDVNTFRTSERPISSKVTVNPYSPPRTVTGNSVGSGLEQSLKFRPVAWWVCWSLLLASIVMDIGIVARRLVLNGIVWFITPRATLGLIVLAEIVMVFAMRWVVFRIILRRRRSGDLRGAVPLVGVIVIFAMVKLIEYQGFRLWSKSGSILEFLLFLAPSLVLAVLLTPTWLAKFHMRGRPATGVSEAGSTPEAISH